jgi:hypothetical protein
MALTKSFFGRISPAARVNTFIRKNGEALITIVILCSSFLLQGDTRGFVGIGDAGSNSELLLTADRKRYTFSGACGGKWVTVRGRKVSAPSILHHHVNTTADVYAALDAIAKENADALLAFPDPVTNRHRKQIADFTIKQRLASVFGWRDYVEAGGLMSYGPNHDVLWKRLALYTDKILKGSKPSELPVELPTKFELVINLKTAKQINVTIPPNVLARADKVIK